MAITKIGGPDTNINPVYNPLVYYFDSTNKAEDGFRYIIEVFEAGTTNKIFEKTIIPDFDDQKCTLNMNREMQDFISYDLDLTELDGNNYRADNSYYRFDLDIGEEYVEVWNWLDFGFAGNVNWPNFNNPQYNPNTLSRTMLYTTSSSNQPPYQNGDVIFVELNNGTQDRPSIQGVQKVLDVYNAGGTGGVYWTVVLDIPWVGNGTSTGGSSKYADFRKSRFTNLLSLNNECVYNTVFKVDDFLDYDSTDYNMVMPSAGTDKFLTQIPNNYKVREDNTLFLQYMSFSTSINNIVRNIGFSNDNGDLSILSASTGTNVGVWGIDMSPTRTNWGTIQNGTLPIIKPNTEWYSIQLLDINGFPLSEEKRIKIDRDCDISQSTMEFLFMDKMGSFLPYNFTARNVEKQNIERSDYTKYLGGYNSTTNKFDYNLTDGGKEIYHSEYTRSFDLGTDYMNDLDSVFFQNVLHSPVTYLKVDGKFRRCVIQTNSITIKKDNWMDRIRYELTVDISQKEMINI